MQYRHLIIDGSYLAFSRFAVGSLPGGFLWELVNLIDEYEPKAIFIAWDHPKGSERRKLVNPDYKFGRKKPDGYFEALCDLQHGLSLIGVCQVQSEEGEGDDVIATIARSFSGEKMIYTLDKDLYQLVSSDVHILRAKSKKIITPENIVEETGLTAAQWVNYLILAGDNCDSIQGVKGIGDKRARDLIAACPNIVELIIEEKSEKIIEAISENNVSLLKIATRAINSLEDILIAQDLIYLRNIRLDFFDAECNSHAANKWLSNHELEYLIGRILITKEKF